MATRFGVLPLVALIAASVHSAPESWIYKFAGQKVGEGKFEWLTDGRFEATADAAISTIKLSSKASGKFTNGKLAELVFAGNNGGHLVEMTYASGKLTAKVDGKEQVKDAAIRVEALCYFSNMFPPMAESLYRQASSNPGVGEFDVFMLDSFSVTKFKVSARSATVTLHGAPFRVGYLNVDLGGLNLQMAFDSEGHALGMNVPVQKITFVKEGFDAVFADPLEKYPELSQPTFQVERELGVRCRLRDGANLATDVVRPKVPGRFPAILIRTPYGRAANTLEGDFWAARGYVLVTQDVRGRGESEGVFDPFNTEVADGKDVLDWLVKQPWSDGSVGMIGGSYLGLVQWSAAVTHHPALKCIIPQVSPPEPVRNIPWDHGALTLAANIWWLRVVKDKQSDMASIMKPFATSAGFGKLPLSKVDDAMIGRNIEFFDAWLKRPTISDWKGAFTLEQVAKVTIPTLHVSGTWDGDGVGTKLHWQAKRSAGHKNQYLIFGPWEHAFNSKTRFGDVDYGPASILELESVYLRFFDAHLKQKMVAWDKQPKVRFFVTGANRWFTGPDWPFPWAKQKTLYLAGGPAVGKGSKGRLLPKHSGITADRYIYNPDRVKYVEGELDPAGTKSTKVQAKDLTSGDLTFASEPMREDTVITGPFTAELYVSTTAKDATFHAMILDKGPTGETRFIGLPGTKRIWFELGKPGPIKPNTIYRITVEPWEFAHLFKKGHRLVLYLTSDMFPQFARNPGTGEPDFQATKLVRATQTVHRSAKYPSKVMFYEFVP